jgi:DNA polymerase elongation subunit (family B)
MKKSSPRVLLIDIETCPLLAQVWDIWQQNISLNQIKRHRSIIAFAAKWLDDDKMIYMDQRNAKNIEDDRKLLEKIWDLLNEADIVVGHNSRQFDTKIINSRFVFHGMKPPSSYKHIDTLVLAKKHFGFVSNKLEHLSDTLNKKYKKLKHEDYPGFELWKSCLEGDKRAWKSMEKYNRYDVLSLQELYEKLIPWDNTVNFTLFDGKCSCGSEEFKKNGVKRLSTGTYQRYVCKNCGSEMRSTTRIDGTKLVGTVR